MFIPLSSLVGVSKHRHKNSPIAVKSFTQWKHHCCITVLCLLQGGWTRWPLKVPSNPNCSMILCISVPVRVVMAYPSLVNCA